MDIVQIKSLTLAISPIIAIIIGVNWSKNGLKHSLQLLLCLVIAVALGVGFGEWLIFSTNYFK